MAACPRSAPERPEAGVGRSRAIGGLALPRRRPGAVNIEAVRASVLVVDDDPVFRRLAARMLEEAGFAVAGQAADARAAVAAAVATRPGGILVDLGLPDRAGAELARELLALPWCPRILLTSADADASDVGDGALRFVAKEDLPNAPLLALLGP